MTTPTVQELLLADFDGPRSPGFAQLFQLLAHDDPRLTALAITVSHLIRGLPMPHVTAELDLAPILSGVWPAAVSPVEPVLLGWRASGEGFEVEALIMSPPERTLWLECNRVGPVVFLVDWSRHLPSVGEDAP